MPLQIVADALHLPAPVVRVASNNWVFAETINLGEATLLLIYRSVALRDSDPDYKDVAALLERHGTVESIYDHPPTNGVVRDEKMMFGHGKWEVYLLHEGAPKEVTNPRAREVIDMLKNWGEPMHPTEVPSSVMARLKPLEGVA
ncbi:hypothetical protein FGG47_gp25 [Mycobacterium phage Rebeuca]|uniref:Uncharacterized protein n=2 Tax=Fromanvirus rebeuca TaxID=1225862 RepID=A0A482JDU3_9CAUD|nr:hypothetical protein FGG47_gp25 [Mycobacterium phage Rebeuca]AFQ97396.1 hypothetical protein REBEUCA_70 [Mycobacterium phage Rebeuca]QBP32017.1 hypothetical protein SEA_KRISTOFF_68 [Mycobacterium phage Kristoff]